MCLYKLHVSLGLKKKKKKKKKGERADFVRLFFVFFFISPILLRKKRNNETDFISAPASPFDAARDTAIITIDSNSHYLSRHTTGNVSAGEDLEPICRL